MKSTCSSGSVFANCHHKDLARLATTQRVQLQRPRGTLANSLKASATAEGGHAHMRMLAPFLLTQAYFSSVAAASPFWHTYT